MPNPQAPKAGRVLGYARVSSREQALGTSLQDQQDRLEAYARTSGLKKVTQHLVEAESAVHEKFERREKMQALMAMLRPGDLVLCDKLDRWSRDPEFTYRSMREIREKGARVYFVDEGIDPTTPEGDSMLNMRVLMAREEHKRIKLRMVGTRKILRNQGLYVEGHPPFGYKRRHVSRHERDRSIERNSLDIDVLQANLVREFFKLSARGWSMADLVVYAQKEHTSRRWDKGTINKILRNRIYLGEIKNSSGVWIRGRHEPIIRPELFTRTQTAIDGRKHGGAKAGSDSRTKNWLVRGLASCIRCGARMGPAYGGGFNGDKNYVDYYRCTRRCGARYVPQGDADEVIGETMLQRLIHLRKEIARPPKTGAATERPVTDFARERVSIEQKRARLLELRLDGYLERDEFKVKMAKLDDARTKIDVAESVENRHLPLQDAEVRRALLASVAKMQDAWENMTIENRRRVVETLASAVRLERDRRPDITWRSPEDLAAEMTPDPG